MSLDTDSQFVSHRVTLVQPSKSGDRLGWSLTFQDGFGIWCPADACAEEPKPGETARLYGRGFGYIVRGIVIDGRVYKYRTATEAEADHEAWVADEQRKRQEQLERELAERDGRRAALPDALRLRIEGFIAARPDWRRDNEGYELFVCEEAAQIAAYFEGQGDERLAKLDAFAKASLEEQRAELPRLKYSEHSGNTWGAAKHLAFLLLSRPDLVPKAHGALCPLLGCEQYGCFAARPIGGGEA